MFDNMTREWIQKFTHTLYEENEKVCILCINSQNTRETEQIIARREDIEKKIKYLRYLNSNKYNIYISVNVLEKEATTRRKEDFQIKQNKIYLDFDSKSEEANLMFKKLFFLMKKNILPEPSMIVKSSVGNYQIYWVFQEKISFENLQNIMRKLNNLFRLDHTHDLARVFRLPGFRNWKREGDLVMMPKDDKIIINKNHGEVINITYKKYPLDILNKISQALNEDISINISEDHNNIRSIEETIENAYTYFKNQTKYKSQSERDIAFCVKIISDFYDELDTVAPILLNFLSIQRHDKSNPVYYARLTLEKAREYVEQKREQKRRDNQNYPTM